MKKIVLTLFCTLCAICLHAQEEVRHMCVTRTDGTVTKIPVSTIERINFSMEVETLELPNIVNQGGNGYVTLAVHVPQGTCNGLYAVGTMNDWDDKDYQSYTFTQVAGTDSWWKVTLPWSFSLELKVLALPSDISLRGWDYQWGDIGKTVLLNNNAEYVANAYGNEAQLGNWVNNSVVYVQVTEWRTAPCNEIEMSFVDMPLSGLSSSPISNKMYSVELSDFTAECQLHMGTYYLLGEGLYVDTDGYLRGAGYIAILNMPTYIIKSPAQYEGYYITEQIYNIVSDENRHYADSVGCALGGAIIDLESYGEWIEAAYLEGRFDTDTVGLAAALESFDASVEGTFIYYIDLNENNQLNYLTELAMLKSGTIISADINRDGIKDFEYQLNVEWFDGFNGLELDETGNILKPYNLVTKAEKYVNWNLMGALQSPALRSKKVATPKQYKALQPIKAINSSIKQVTIKAK